MVELRGSSKRVYVADLFSRISGRYDVMNTVMTFGMDRLWRRTAATEAMLGLQGPVLDVATGTGNLALELGRNPGSTYVVGMDLLNAMVSRAARKISDKACIRPTTFMTGDALSIPFVDNSFACVTSAFSLRNMPDLELALREMVRVARPGGKVLSLEIMPSSRGLLAFLVRQYLRFVLPLMGSLIAFDRAAYTYLPRSVDKFLPPQELEALFKRVGLNNVRSRRLGLGGVHLHWGIKES